MFCWGHVCYWILALIIVLFVLWVFWGGTPQEFIGLKPLDPKTRGDYMGPNFTRTPLPPPCFPPEEVVPANNIPPALTEIPHVNNTPQVREIYQNKSAIPSNETYPESLCRRTFETFYPGYKFVKIRPDWLVNPETNHRLELDGYNKELNIAFEYNGIQHYVWPNWTNMSYAEFIQQIRRDQYKMDVCDNLGIYLIVIPYNVSLDMIPEYIRSLLPEG